MKAMFGRLVTEDVITELGPKYPKTRKTLRNFNVAAKLVVMENLKCHEKSQSNGILKSLKEYEPCFCIDSPKN